jgi:Domain of unknown function (DUF3850)
VKIGICSQKDIGVAINVVLQKQQLQKMSRQHHYIKCETQYYQLVEKGLKKFELRKDDRNYQVYDMVYLKETVNGVFTGRELSPKEISYIYRDGMYGIEKGYCIFCWND